MEKVIKNNIGMNYTTTLSIGNAVSCNESPATLSVTGDYICNYLTNYLLSAAETSTAIARLQRAFLVCQFGAPTMDCCLWRVIAAFVANVSKLPFTHLHITCPMPRKLIIFGVCGSQRTSGHKRNLFVLPSANNNLCGY